MIGDQLRTIRETKKLTQEGIEERTGLSRAYVSRVENGEAMPSMEALEKWARALLVPLHELHLREKEPPMLPNLTNRLTADDIVRGNSRKNAARPPGERRA